MQNVGDMLTSVFSRIGASEHIPVNPGDFVGDDGFLHCGVCGERREFKLPFNGHMVPSLCACGRAERDSIERRERERQAAAQMAELASYSLIDRRFRESTFDKAVRTDDNAQALDLARRYCRDWPLMLEKNIGLLLYGPPGTGKTYLAACIANELMRQRVPVLATSIIKLASVDADSLNETLHRMRSADLVILDDFGVERDTSTMQERVFNIIDTRYSNRKPMIITTNIDIAKLSSGGDVRTARVCERIRAMCRVVKLSGTSWRRQETEALYDWR